MRGYTNRENKSKSVFSRISVFANKIKNKERYKNAAYYTLSSENYVPKFSSLFLCFNSSGLGFVDSLFNAAYMYAGEREYRTKNKLKKCYGSVALHPHGYGRSCFKLTWWSAVIKVLEFIPRIKSLLVRLSSSLCSREAGGENSFDKFARTARFCKKNIAYILPMVTAIAVGAFIYNASLERIVLSVSYDGVEIGNVENSAIVGDALKAAEDTLSESTGYYMKLSDNISYKVVKARRPEYTASGELYGAILEQAKKDYTTAYGLYIDGTLVAPLESKTEIEEVLDEISGESSGIANGIQILRQDYPQEAIKSGDELKQMLGASPEKLVMTSGSVPSTENTEKAPVIIRDIPAPVDPGSVDFSNAYAIDGDKTLEILYKTEVQEQKTVDYEYETVYEYDTNIYTTSKYVKQKGKNGSKKITESIIYVNGEEQSRTVIDEEIIKEPVNRIIVKGLKPIPESVSDTRLVWPIEYFVNEKFGWRLRNNSYMEYHAGIDMAAPCGTPILAAASGVVEQADNQYNGYGKMVIIRHTDGRETFYAHMNDIYVSVGDIVTQGEVIGEVGSTGDSTGYHLHFEVRVNGVAQDPLNFLVPKGE